ncbi:hypothetical protein H8792_005770 [Thiomicrorhabdus sp. HH1]|uniref:Low-complexity protein n=2 Tax=Piscirickettsiaceae TaxID=135616 RepID=A0ABS0BXP0_9GAMM|nr:hypothetical protein [Thiomicrorhabdus heinhorstiae]
MKAFNSITSMFAVAVFGFAMLGTVQTAAAAENPFGLSAQQDGFMLLASEKCGAGKCGAEKPAQKCGGEPAKKCGAEKPMKCGAGKCGGTPPAEKKCGAGKCGGSK